MNELTRTLFPGHRMFPGERRHRLTDLAWRTAARHLPHQLRYHALIQAGVGHMRNNEVVPEVPFTVILERFGKPIDKWPTPPCTAALNLAGEHHPCDWPTDENGTHTGWAHTNRDAEAQWADDPQAIHDAWGSAEAAGR